MHNCTLIFIAVTIYNSSVPNVTSYLIRRYVYTSNNPLLNLYMIGYSNEELELGVSRHIEGLIRKSRDFNLDGNIDQGQTQSIYPPPGTDSKYSSNEDEDSMTSDDEETTKVPKCPDIKPKGIPETFLSSIVQLPDYDDEDWCPDFYIGDLKSPGSEFIEKNNDYILEWANTRRRSRGLPPIKVKWKKLPETSYLNDKALNLQNVTDVITSETRPTEGNYTCGNIWNVPELQEEYELVKNHLLKRAKDDEHYASGGEQTFYDKLPRDENGIAIFNRVQDIEK